jgi:hypothetical protein
MITTQRVASGAQSPNHTLFTLKSPHTDPFQRIFIEGDAVASVVDAELNILVAQLVA